MQSLSVVLYQNDPRTAQNLASGLSQHFDSVYLVRSYEELSPAIGKRGADAVVLDLETSGPGEVARLHHEFPSLCIVGTHRLADDKLWAEAKSLAFRLVILRCHAETNSGAGTRRRRCRARTTAAAPDPASYFHPSSHAPQRVRRRQTPASDPLRGVGTHDPSLVGRQLASHFASRRAKSIAPS